MRYISYLTLTLALLGCNSYEYNPNDFEKIELKLKEDILYQLEDLRTNALNQNDFSNTKEWFSAKINLSNSHKKAKIRLKGDQYDHYDTEQFSLRVKYKTKGNKTVFSIQHPKTRNYITEWIFHQLLKQEGLPYLDYKFVSVAINNTDRGIYAYEEHLSNANIERKWDRVHGPILGFDDTGFWGIGLDAPERFNDFKNFDTRSYQEAKIKCFNYDSEQQQSDIHQTAVQNLKSYQNNTVEANEIFDLNLFAKFYAICDLTGARHGLRWLNLRFYFNPTTQLFEPVGFDSNSGELSKLVTEDDYINAAFHKKIISNPTFQKAYINYLKTYSKKAFLDSFLAKHEQELDLYSNTFEFTQQVDCSVYINNYYSNQETIQEHLNK